ncbi:MAG: hypothetical protein HQL46_04550 [Gammaproteobacteria bacterium]|nr:hypothetical protein [Gammaproteobacteria bacterium]
MIHNYRTILLAVSITLFSSMVHASVDNAVTQGRAEFEARCQQCHGASADGEGHLVDFLKIKPANLTILVKNGMCVTDKVLKAVLGRHKSDYKETKMPLLKDALSLDKVYFISEYVKSLQQK